MFRSSYVAPGFSDDNEDLWVESMLSTRTGEDNYPRDGAPSESWPGFGAGGRDVLNTMSGVRLDLTGIVDLLNKPAILWVHGSVDAIVGDESFFDLHTLGKHGIIPGWPGEDVAPPQPIMAQTREVLGRYSADVGEVREELFEGAGHSPHLDAPERFRRVVEEFLGAAGGGSGGICSRRCTRGDPTHSSAQLPCSYKCNSPRVRGKHYRRRGFAPRREPS